MRAKKAIDQAKKARKAKKATTMRAKKAINQAKKAKKAINQAKKAKRAKIGVQPVIYIGNPHPKTRNFTI